MSKQITFYVTLTVEQDADPDILFDDVLTALEDFADWQGSKDPRVDVSWPDPAET